MKTTTDIEVYAALDFEASSLSPDSWPIEVGLSWLENGYVQTWSSLIRPASNWSLFDWSLQSAAVHGITLEALHDAPIAAEVVDKFFEHLTGKVPVSGASRHKRSRTTTMFPLRIFPAWHSICFTKALKGIRRRIVLGRIAHGSSGLGAKPNSTEIKARLPARSFTRKMLRSETQWPMSSSMAGC
ncbi:3'-5' exonuclease [Roseovarius sp. D0-M9]|uniref:3'-5' exonuclease n=1 Tax=Roseovarius sp. D0-M9 TaxID=3127117 RepID=UPI00301054F9